MLTIIVNRACSPWLHTDTFFRISTSGRRYFKSLEQEMKFIRKVNKPIDMLFKKSDNDIWTKCD